MSVLLLFLLAAAGAQAAQPEEAARRFDEQAAGLEAAIVEFEKLAPALREAGNLDAAARDANRRFSALTDAAAGLDAAKRRYGIAARSAVASAVVSSARKEKVERPDYDRSMSLLDRESAMGARSKELAIRSVAAHQAFVKALRAERGRRRSRNAAASLLALFLAGAAGAWAWLRVKSKHVPAPPSRPTPRKLPPRRGPGRLE